jgi:hypothetical protein
MAVAVAVLLVVSATAYSQWKEPPATGSPENNLPDRTTLVGQSGMGPLLIAKLVDADENAKKHQAVVQVETDGVLLVDPAAAHHEPKLDEAHIQYRLDGGPIDNSTAKYRTFDHLSSGEHRIWIALASSDGHQMGKGKTLKVRIP